MNATTAGAALILAQICTAFVMAGIFYAAPQDKCTRDWALSAALVAAGVLMVVLNGGALRPLVLVIGNTAVIAGGILQWCGLRAFFGKQANRLPSVLGLTFVLLFTLLVLREATVRERAMLSSTWILIVIFLSMREVWKGSGMSRSFARLVILAALAITMCAHGVRLLGLLTNAAELLPGTDTVLAVGLIYFLPMIGSMTLWTGLLLLYFERVIADKHHLATHDELSGVFNRRAIVASAEREVAIANRMARPLAIAFVDIDHFKRINDRLGHETGDRIIRDVARTLQQNCRAIDLVGRYGGDEFCIVLPGADSDSTRALGERLVGAVRHHEWDTGQPVTISIGFVALPNDRGDYSFDDLIRRADQELYKAKALGRNRISVAGGADVGQPAIQSA